MEIKIAFVCQKLGGAACWIENVGVMARGFTPYAALQNKNFVKRTCPMRCLSSLNQLIGDIAQVGYQISVTEIPYESLASRAPLSQFRARSHSANIPAISCASCATVADGQGSIANEI